MDLQKDEAGETLTLTRNPAQVREETAKKLRDLEKEIGQ
jgi:hypothetical protein